MIKKQNYVKCRYHSTNGVGTKSTPEIEVFQVASTSTDSNDLDNERLRSHETETAHLRSGKFEKDVCPVHSTTLSFYNQIHF